MADLRPWAIGRRLQYGSVYGLIVFLALLSVYFSYFYEPTSCFDGAQNGDERGSDCGGNCLRICPFDVTPPVISWAESFEITEGQYNALAYIENLNAEASTPSMRYTFRLYDRNDVVIAERSGFTVLPPNSTYPIFEGRISTGLSEPVRTEIELEEPELWLPAIVGRDQFRTVDFELKGADERPRLDVELENTRLTEAQNVEVVATIFDSAGTPLTASQTYIDIFPPDSREAIVFTWPEPISTTVRSCVVPTDIMLAIDLSGSMNNDSDNPPQPLTTVLASARGFVSNLRQDDQAGLVTFATEARINERLRNDPSFIKERISLLAIDPAEEQGATNVGDALYQAQDELNSIRHNTDARSVIVLLTDGLATAPENEAEGIEPEAYAREAAAVLRDDNIVTYTIGLGDEVNMQFLRDIASSPENAYAAADTDALTDIYRSITSAICEDGAARIDIIPKTDTNFPEFPG